MRAASHELKTPLTALNATLENMILGIGKYQNVDVYLPECKDMAERLSEMIQEILETSKLGVPLIREAPVKADLSSLLAQLCEPYEQIAKARKILFKQDLSGDFPLNCRRRGSAKRSPTFSRTPSLTRKRVKRFRSILTAPAW